MVTRQHCRHKVDWSPTVGGYFNRRRPASVRLTGRGSPGEAHRAIKAAKDRSWESYKSIERFITGTETCRRRQILDHFGDDEQGMPSGRCCDVCDPDLELQRAMSARVTRGSRGAAGGKRGARATGGWAAGAPAAGEPVDEEQFERLKAWRWERAEGKPAYTVAANAVLEEVLRRRPQSIDALGGPAFCKKHGESLLGALAELGADSAVGTPPEDSAVGTPPEDSAFAAPPLPA